MAEYIEREKLPQKKERGFFMDDDFNAGWNACLNNIKAIPAADVRPVVRGKWVDNKGSPVPWDKMNKNCPSHGAYCSVCGDWLTASDEYSVIGNFCPNCGADMREPPFYAPTSRPIVTNYDRIISKTPEELARWIWAVQSEIKHEDLFSTDGWHIWLMQEAKEGE